MTDKGYEFCCKRFEEAVNRALAQPYSFGNIADPIQPVRHADQNFGPPRNRIDQPWAFDHAPAIPNISWWELKFDSKHQAGSRLVTAA